MVCQKCGTEILESQNFCKNCGEPVKREEKTLSQHTAETYQTNMAQLCVRAKKFRHFFWLLCNWWCPPMWHYKVYIHVDDKEYVMNSKNKEMRIPVVPGAHSIYISGRHHNLRTEQNVKSAAKMGTNIAVMMGFSNVARVSHAVDISRVTKKDYSQLFFEPGKTEEIKVKQGFMWNLVVL